MKHELYDILLRKKGQVAVLVDPDKVNSEEALLPLLKKIDLLNPAYIFIGGSTVNQTDFENCISIIKNNSKIPIVLFPGSPQQISPLANGILFLSLISGRNPDFLIGHQVETAHILKKMEIETISTGYILVDGGKTSAVSYVSQTTPIPSDQTTIAVNTAIAGEMLGLKALFLDAGSGAINPVKPEMIAAIRTQTELPIIVGGGIKSVAQMEAAMNAGANLVVIGNRIEEDIDFLLDIKLSLENLIKK